MRLPGREVEHYPVVVTVEAVALGWLRQRDAPAGAVVVADSEIAARSRRGDPWDVPEAVRAAVILRPALAAGAADLLWAHALLAVAEVTGGAPLWPETVAVPGEPDAMVRVSSQLGPGAVESAVVTIRMAAGPSGEARLDAVLARLDDLAGLPAAQVAAAFRAADPTAGATVSVSLLPRGTLRGTSRSIDEQGALVVEGASGGHRRLSVDQIAAVT